MSGDAAAIQDRICSQVEQALRKQLHPPPILPPATLVLASGLLYTDGPYALSPEAGLCFVAWGQGILRVVQEYGALVETCGFLSRLSNIHKRPLHTPGSHIKEHGMKSHANSTSLQQPQDHGSSQVSELGLGIAGYGWAVQPARCTGYAKASTIAF